MQQATTVSLQLGFSGPQQGTPISPNLIEIKEERVEGLGGFEPPTCGSITLMVKLAMQSIDEIGKVLKRARRAAVDYYRLTGKPLGITGEIGEYEAAKRLGLTLAEAREPGYDATDRRGRRIQIKSRSIPRSRKPTGQRMGVIRLEHDWDVVLLVLMDETFKPTAMYEASRGKVKAALRKTNSRARARGALAITEFIRFGKRVWPE